MQETLAILEALPPAHRQHLIAANKESMKTAKNRLDKLQTLARLVTAEALNEYRDLYLAGNGRLFTWYQNLDLNLSPEQIEAALVARYTNARTGLKPAVMKGDAPKFHRISSPRGLVRLSYVLYGGTVVRPDGWGEKSLLQYKFPVVMIYQGPFTIELRGVQLGKRQALMQAVRDDLGIAPDVEFTLCNPDTEKLQTALEEKLDAVFRGEHRVGRDRGLASFIISSKQIALYHQFDYLRNAITDDVEGELSHHVVHARSWEFLTRHPVDGYMEKATYAVVVETGDVRISEGASELAIQNLRRNLLEIF